MKIYRLFESINDFWNFAIDESSSEIIASRDHDSEWNGGISWNDACHLAKYGWMCGMDEIEKWKTELDLELNNLTYKRKYKWNVYGFHADVGKYLSNEPEHFYNFEKKINEGSGKIYKLVYSLSMSSAIDPEIIIQKGAITACLIDSLERLGNRVEIVLNENTQCGNNYCEYDIILKKANENLQMIELAFPLVHPAMLRRIVFSANEKDGWADLTGGSYGTPISATNKGDIYISEINSGLVSNNEAISWILNQLEKLNIKIYE